MSTVLGLIVALAGSKGLERKNIRSLAERPLIAWTIIAALESTQLDRVIVSTDDPEIAAVAKEWGAEVPFLRPEQLAQDDTTAEAVAMHTLDWLKSAENYCPEFLMLLQPTSPLRTALDITTVIQMAQEQAVTSIVSVCPIERHPRIMKTVSEQGRLVDYTSAAGAPAIRQSFPPMYALNGAIYLVACASFIQVPKFCDNSSIPYFMPSERSIDIDTPWDFFLADLVLRSRLTAPNK